MYTVYYLEPLEHHGIKGQKWGVRRYRNRDGTLTPAGKKRYRGPGVAIDDNKQRFYLAKKGFASDREMAYAGNVRNSIADKFGGDERARTGVALAEATATAAIKGHMAAKAGRAIATTLYQRGFFNNADIPFAVRAGAAIMLTPQMQYALQVPAAMSKYKYAQDSMATDAKRTEAGKPKISRYEKAADDALMEKNSNIMGYRDGLKMDFSRGKHARAQARAAKYEKQINDMLKSGKPMTEADHEMVNKAVSDMGKRGYKVILDYDNNEVYFERKTGDKS